MRNLIMASASALALMGAATGAAAQTAPTVPPGTQPSQELRQNGNNNRAVVNQGGTASSLKAASTLTQTGNANNALINQTVNSSTGNAGVTSNVTQNGGLNLAIVNQTAAGTVANSSVTINQFSSSAAANATPLGIPPNLNADPDPLLRSPAPKGTAASPSTGNTSEGNRAFARQSGGANNSITINQGEETARKDGNYAYVQQLGGGGNQSQVNQYATDGFAYSRQNGSDNVSTITQRDSLSSPGDDPSAVVSQTGVGNTSTVEQTNATGDKGFLTATVTQVDGAWSSITQRTNVPPSPVADRFAASNFEATVVQRGSSTNESTILQTEATRNPPTGATKDLSATVTQNGSELKSEVYQSGWSATAIINQSGDNQKVVVNQNLNEDLEETNFGFGRVTVTQRRNDNEATITQRGITSRIVVNQLGVGGTVFYDQTVESNRAQGTINQTSNSTNGYVDVRQTGVLFPRNVQFGPITINDPITGLRVAKNGVDVTQSANSNTAIVDQAGVNNYSDLIQSGDVTYIKIEQDGTDNQARVTQSGDNTTSLINQLLNTSQGNQVTVNQATNNAWSSVTQSGSNHIANVTQGPAR